MGNRHLQMATMLKVEPKHLLRGDHANQFKYGSCNVGFTFARLQKIWRIFLNATVVLNLAGWCNITDFLKRANRFRVIGLYWGCIPKPPNLH